MAGPWIGVAIVCVYNYGFSTDYEIHGSNFDIKIANHCGWLQKLDTESVNK